MPYIRAIDKTRIHYKIRRNSENKPVLMFIHGLALNNTFLKSIAEHFAQKSHTVINIDLRGHGKSDRPKDPGKYGLGAFTQDIKDVLENENISEAVLIGHSIGTMVSLNYCLAYPKKVKALALFNPIYALKFDPPTKLYELLIRHSRFVAGIAEYLHNCLKPFLKYFSEYDFNRHINCPDEELFWNGLVETGASARYVYDALIKEDLSKSLPKIKAPTLIVSCSKDEIVPVGVGKKLKKLIKKSELKLVEGTHAFPLKEHRLASELIEEFIEKTKQ